MLFCKSAGAASGRHGHSNLIYTTEGRIRQAENLKNFTELDVYFEMPLFSLKCSRFLIFNFKN